MKKSILTFFLLSSAISFAQKYQAKITYPNSVKTGLLDPISQIDKKGELLYKPSESAKPEKISVTDATKIEYSDANGVLAVAENLNVPDIGKIWAYKIYDKDLVVYANSLVDKTTVWPNYHFNVITGNLSYYIMKYKDGNPQLVSTFLDAGPMTVNTFQKKFNEKLLLKFFEDKCPKLVAAYNNKEFKIKKDPYPFVENFEKYCK